MGYRMITQIILIVTAVLIVFTYVRPTLVGVKSVEDQAHQYTGAVTQASEYNQHLGSLIQKENSFSPANIKAVETFLPPSIDNVAVVADINTIASQANLVSKTISVDKRTVNVNTPNPKLATSSAPSLTHTDFSVTLNGTYSDFQQFLLLLAENKYQLDITKLTVGQYVTPKNDPTGTPTADYELTLRAYALPH